MDEAGAGLVAGIVELLFGAGPPVVLGILRSEEGALVMVEPPCQVRIARVLEVDDRILVTIEERIFEELGGFMGHAGVGKLCIVMEGAALKTAEEGGRSGPVETMVVIENSYAHSGVSECQEENLPSCLNTRKNATILENFLAGVALACSAPAPAQRPGTGDNRSLADTFYVQNFGCRASQADGAALQAGLAARGLCPADARSAADIVVLNTCTVTASADYDVRQTIRRVHRENPQTRILVTGCYAQRAPQELADLPGVEWVVGNSHKTQIVNIVNAASLDPAPYHGRVLVGDVFAQTDLLTFPYSGSRNGPGQAQSQDTGRLPQLRCSRVLRDSLRARRQSFHGSGPRWSSTWCVRLPSPLSRGGPHRHQSGDAGDARRGARCASPICCGAFLAETDIDRIRISSVEPMDFTDELLGLMAGSPRIARHVACAPCNRDRMPFCARCTASIGPRHYADRVGKARRLMPEAGIGADVMTGFPGETDALFEESRQFIESMPFTYLHVFTYSERPGTKAVTMEGAVPMEVRRERNRVLRELGEKKGLEFRARLAGRRLSAVTLEQRGTALTTNFLRVVVDRDLAPNRVIEVTL